MSKKLTGVQIGIVITTVITALIHLLLVPPLLRDSNAQNQMIGTLFILNGLGYLGLLTAYFLPQPFFRKNHGLVRWGLIAFAAVTIIGWLIINRDFTDPLGVASKLAEVILIVLLFLDRPKP